MQSIEKFLAVVPNPMMLLDRAGQIVLANQHARKLFEYLSGELRGRSITTLMPERYRGQLAGHLKALDENPDMRASGSGVELTVCGPDVSEIPVEMSLSPYEASDGRYTLVSLRVIGECVASEMRIRHLEKVLAMQSRINALILGVRERETLFREACRIAVDVGAFSMAWIGLIDEEISELRPQASFGQGAEQYLNELLAAGPILDGPAGAVIREDRQVLIENCRQHPVPAMRRAGCDNLYWSSITGLPLHRGGKVVGLIALYAREIGVFDEEENKLLSELASSLSFAIEHLDNETTLRRLEHRDRLTGLGNRAGFMGCLTHHLRSAMRSNQKLAVLEFDLERFRNVNDWSGHSAGDMLLKQVAKWMVHRVGDADLLARVDADHFTAVIPRIEHAADVELLVEGWVNALRDHPFGGKEDSFRISMKVGISIYPEDGVTACALFRSAEAALKQAKASRNRYLFHTKKMSERGAGKFVLENQLRRALDREEFVLHYQPKVNTATGELAGVEALIRWNDPETGLVQPNRFIPLLEETGLICDVGRWALRKSMEDALRWRQMYSANVRVAVNVSPLQLRNRQFLRDIECVLASHADAAAHVELEVTEGMIMEDIEYSIETLRAIRAQGITIAIDDFGTGFSSFNYLAKLPLDTLKVDRSFVADLTQAEERFSQISAIVKLAHSMHVKVVAEGVETDEQSEMLRMLGCDEMQGFLFSKPLPCSVFESRYLREGCQQSCPPIAASELAQPSYR